MQRLKKILLYLLICLITMTIGHFVSFFLINVNIINGESMEPNYHDGQICIGNRLSRFSHNYGRYQTIVFGRENGKTLIKRIIGLPGETIEIKQGVIYINDNKIKDPYRNTEDILIGNKSKTKIGPHEYFVLGDNRAHSTDSREFGVIKEDAIKNTILLKLPF